MPLRQMEEKSISKYDTPAFNDNRMKLGIFGINCSFGCTISEASAEGSFQPTYDHNLKIARKADEMGIEVLLPLGRWKGHGGSTDFNGTNMETHTWATSMATATENIMCLTTSHVPAYHPVTAAKQGATIDHVSGGRYGINIVAGWWEPEMEMFGGKQLGHDERYERAHEWIEIIKKMWTEEEFDYEGDFYQVHNGYMYPKPIQKPTPLIVNAGTSEAGRDFAAKHADINFANINTLEDAEEISSGIQQVARERYGREKVNVFSYGLVVCRETEEEAREVYDHILEEGDYEATRNIIDILGLESGSFQETIEKYADSFIAGWGGYELVGTPEQVVEEMIQLRESGIDGFMMSFLDYNEEIDYVGDEVIPLMEEAGLRTPFEPGN